MYIIRQLQTADIDLFSHVLLQLHNLHIDILRTDGSCHLLDIACIFQTIGNQNQPFRSILRKNGNSR